MAFDRRTGRGIGDGPLVSEDDCFLPIAGFIHSMCESHGSQQFFGLVTPATVLEEMFLITCSDAILQLAYPLNRSAAFCLLACSA